MTILHPIHTDSKRLPSKIRYARPVACQGAAPAANPAERLGGVSHGHSPALIKPLYIGYTTFTAAGLCWK